MILKTTPGMHRFTWDVHYQPVDGVNRVGGPTLPIAAIGYNTVPVPSTPWANPGSYTVRLTVNGKSYTQPIVVKQDPRVKTPALAHAADLHAVAGGVRRSGGGAAGGDAGPRASRSDFGVAAVDPGAGGGDRRVRQESRGHHRRGCSGAVEAAVGAGGRRSGAGGGAERAEAAERRRRSSRVKLSRVRVPPCQVS